MPVEIPASHRDLLTKITFAHLATTRKDGSPQVTPIWFDTDAGTCGSTRRLAA